MENIRFKFAVGLENLPQCRGLRVSVFLDEQKFKEEFDEIDNIATHELMIDGDKPIGTARAFPLEDSGDTYILGRVCVLKDYRGKNLGKLMLEKMEEHLKSKGIKKIKLSAQVRVKEFYQKLGYTEYGEEYLDEYCPHIGMIKEL